MKRALQAEIRKLRYQRSTYGILGVATLLSIVTAVSGIAASQLPNSGAMMDLELQTTMRSVMGAAASGYTFALVLGIVMSTTEFRHSTAVATYLAEPNRRVVMTAKMVAAAVMGVALQLVSTVLSMLAAAAYASRYPHFALPLMDYLNILSGALLCGAVLAVVGVAVGMLIRSQMVAVVLALLWLQLIEGLILVFATDLGKWSMTGAITSVLSIAVQGPDLSITAADLLSPWASIVLLLGYAAVFATAATLTTMRRDID